MNGPYIDLHTHSCLSDGNLTPEALLTKAREAGIGILALTDHNATADLTALRAACLSCPHGQPQGATPSTPRP